MTLVVAKIVENNIYIESDSRITDPTQVRSYPLTGLLKTIILHPFVCLSFAGIVDYAEKFLRDFFENRVENININILLKMLLEVHKQSGHSTDFIVASIIDRIPKLYKIENGAIDDKSLNHWIGNYKGFEIYQENFLTDSNLPIKDKMREAFKKTIDSPKLGDIGDFHISTCLDYNICPTHPVFLYDSKTEINVSEPQVINIEKANVCYPMPLGTAAGGSSGISYLRSMSPNRSSVAIHFPHGNFGILFCPQIDPRAGTVIKDVTGLEFAKKIKHDYGIPLAGFIMNPNTSLQFIDTRFNCIN